MMIGACKKRKASDDSIYEGEKKFAKVEVEDFTSRINNYESGPLTAIEAEESGNNNKAYAPASPSTKEIAEQNSSNRAYGLRPRADLRKPSYDCDAEEKEILPVRPTRPHRGRGRSSLMTKYRRRTANDRERLRMKEINGAFTTLRGILPVVYTKRSSQVTMTKIRILKLAASYIKALSNLLSGEESDNTNNEPCMQESHFDDIVLGSSESQTMMEEGVFSQCHNDSTELIQQISNSQSQPLKNSFSMEEIQQVSKSKKEDEWGDSTESPSDRELISLLEEVTALEENNNEWHKQTFDEMCFPLT